MEQPRTVKQVATGEKVIAFTFDDGPNAVYTPQMLEIFREAGGKATFYMIGEQIEANRAVAEAVHAEGHEIGNHTYAHPNLTAIEIEAAAEEMSRTDALIREVTGEAVRTFRAPYLAANEEVLALAAEMGYATIGALNTETHDWEQPGVAHILDKSRDHLVPGGILLFHDGHGDRSQSVEAVRALVRELVADGFRLVTVRELLEMGEGR
ncbi:polysaccharide deacetylase family protein [Paenibacillus methanolicus]|uniref:Peptidoglycan/xylan/chitin deacetylase (PgdA/CDA1 family) n=1 Tax=Paenibacillus methanolicus TaxID=582686 RepID=A0A5S5C9K3_9BACL|nr:polysaccharide deacetylase family protein [Paenibacillus methanolicus]TYP74663.1 peptidoglycan/xylan/chitin deacetylase (PgdA/CDA1 family) [Paenibacillus methanolicus]